MHLPHFVKRSGHLPNSPNNATLGLTPRSAAKRKCTASSLARLVATCPAARLVIALLLAAVITLQATWRNPKLLRPSRFEEWPPEVDCDNSLREISPRCFVPSDEYRGSGSCKADVALVVATSVVQRCPHRWIFQSTAELAYNHMAMISKLPQKAHHSWIAMWQSAPAREGTVEQRLLYSTSLDARRWTLPQQVDFASGPGCVWSPVLHLDPATDTLWLFYSESTTCIRPSTSSRPERWSPGGDIRYVTSPDGIHWSPFTVILSNQADGHIPKVIANQMVRVQSGQWVLPYWRERPHLKSFVNGCITDESVPASAGVLLSSDRGTSWTPHGALVLDNTWLIEGALAEAHDGRLLMLFRTVIGSIFESESWDKGLTWSTPSNTTLPNPNSKVSLLRLDSGDLALAFNDSPDRGKRMNLRVAISRDNGETWGLLAEIEGAPPVGAREDYAYPTMLQDGCRLLVVYSVLHGSMGGGIRIAEVDLSPKRHQALSSYGEGHLPIFKS